MNINPVKILSRDCFLLCPAWRYDEDSDFYYPVMGVDDLPEMIRDLRIMAKFKAPAGHVFDGYISGVDRIFSIGLFFEERVYYVNKNIASASRMQVNELLSKLGIQLDFEDIFPLHYETCWGGCNFSDFSGNFDM